MNTENRSLIGDRLRQERERLDFSQAEMAALGGVKPRTYQDWERGIAVVSAQFLATTAPQGLDVGFVITGQRVARQRDAIGLTEAGMVANGIAIALALDVVGAAHVQTYARRLRELAPAVGASDKLAQKLLECAIEGVDGFLANR